MVSSFVNLLFSLAAILLVMLITRSPFYWTILLVWAPLCCCWRSAAAWPCCFRRWRSTSATCNTCTVS
ncbi:hypothetical protein NIA69_21205 [Gemmiger formicilis]|nr:hypothetical protein [Gemmiger formicilis]